MISYNIENDWLTPSQNINHNLNKYSNGWNICDYVIIHYTASRTAKSAHNTFLSPAKVSWHITVDRDGSIFQLYDFRKVTWHAGISSWKRPNGSIINGLNRWSIGIEVANYGKLSYNNGLFKNAYGKIVENNEVYKALDGTFWHDYTPEQIKTLKEIVPVLCKKYKCLDVLGHEEISPTRKIDPGRAMDKTLETLKSICKDIRNDV